jgi:hypothetical protein
MLLTECTQTYIKKNLVNHIAARYAHTDQSKGLCAKDTRVELLADIQEWLSVTRNAHFVTARSCLEMISRAGSQDVRSYAITYWHRHLRQAVEKGHECKDDRLWELLAGIVNGEDPIIMKDRPVECLRMLPSLGGYSLQ